MRTWIWLPVIGLLALLGAGALLAEPFALRVALSQAKARGLELEPGDLRLGLFSATLEDSTVRLEGVESVQIELDEVRVQLGLTSPRIRKITVDGGRLRIDGTVEQIREELRAFSRRHAAAESSTAGVASGPRRVEQVRKFDIEWKNALGRGERQSVQGLIAERSAEGQRVAADLVSLDLGALGLEVAGASLTASAGGLDFTRITQAHAAEARVTYQAQKEPGQAESKGRESPDDSLVDAPSADGSPAADDPPAEEESQKSSGLARLLTPDPGRVTRVRSAFALMNEKLLPRLPAQLSVDRLWVSYERGTEKLHVGPNRLVTRVGDEGLRVSVTPQGEADGTPLSLTLFVPRRAESVLAGMELEGGPVALSTLGIQEGAFGLVGLTQTTIFGNFQASLDRDASHLSSEGQVTVEGLSIDSRRLSDQIVSFPKLFASGRAQLKVDGSSYEVSGAELSMGEARMQGDFALNKGDDYVTLQVNLDAPLVSCQALVESAPRGLMGLVDQIEFRGTFSLKAGVEADTRDLSKMKVRWDFKNGCHAQAVPRALDPDQFRRVFRREVIGAGHFPLELEFGPHSLNWTPYEDVSPYVETALLVSEDGRFYRHDGFDDRAIESAITQNTRAGTFVRGASTISMQLAKNLYLSRDKTLARKLQEAALTSLLEQSFEKRELLELYVNIVEYGPSVYGVSQAAAHYFNTDPRNLTAAQAFFLVSILPAPTVSYFEEDGTLNPAREKYVHHLLGIAQKRGRLSESELQAALQEELRFGRSETRPRDAIDDPLAEEGAFPHSDQDLLLTMPSPAALRPKEGQDRRKERGIKRPGGPDTTSDDQSNSSEAKGQVGGRKETPKRPPPPPAVDPTRRGIHL